MSHNENRPERSARNHRPAIWAIAVALAVAVVAFLVLAPMDGGPETKPTETLAPGSDAGTGAATDTTTAPPPPSN